MFWTAFILGLASGFHCIGMCGPLVMALPHGGSSQRFINGRLLYNLGRILTYTILGILFGLIGEVVNLVAYQSTVFLVTGIILLVLLLLTQKFGERVYLVNHLQRFVSRLKSAMSKRIATNSYQANFTFGLLNGFLPCGMVYLALFASVTQVNVLSAAAYMAVFGLGTFPLMFFLAMSGRMLSLKWRNLVNKRAPYLVALVAMLFVVRGLALGIPYISPKIEIYEGKVISTCCTPLPVKE